MALIGVSHQARKNHLLAALPDSELEAFGNQLQLVSLSVGNVLYESGDTITHVYFPTTAVVSLLYIMEDGNTAEIGLAGNNGAIGNVIFLGGETTLGRAIVQNAGEAVRIKSAPARAAFESQPVFHDVMLRYVQSLLVELSQTAVCNRLHTIEQRLCRWLLVNDDLHPSHRLEMTQDWIANNLGVRREGVSAAANHLQKQGMIEYSRGVITVIDRDKLQADCCECYQVATEEYYRLLGKYIPLERPSASRSVYADRKVP